MGHIHAVVVCVWQAKWLRHAPLDRCALAGRGRSEKKILDRGYLRLSLSAGVRRRGISLGAMARSEKPPSLSSRQNRLALRTCAIPLRCSSLPQGIGAAANGTKPRTLDPDGTPCLSYLRA